MRRLAVILVAAFSAVLMAPTPAVAGGEVVPVEGYRSSTWTIDPGTAWETGPPRPDMLVLHVRHALNGETWEGGDYLAGTSYNDVNLNAHLACSAPFVCDVHGALWGTARIELDAFDGGWDGQAAFQVTGVGLSVSFEGWFTARGWGELEGWRLKLWVVQDGTTLTETFSGYVTPPPGQ